MIETILTFVLLAGYFFLEALFRKRGSAKSMERGGSDSGSTLVLGASYGIAVALLVVFTIVGVGVIISPVLGWIGIAVMILGLALRAWSMQVLGSSYSRTLKVTGSQSLVVRGPYRIIRHPGYLGSILIWVGAGVAVTNWIAIVSLSLMMIGVYVYRIQTEERMLVTAFGTVYSQYQKRSWRLLPPLF